MTQAEKAQVDDLRYVPAALALHQRPGGSGHAKYVRNIYRTFKCAAVDVFPPVQPLLSKGPLSAADHERGGGNGTGVSGVRRAFLSAVCGRTVL